MNPAAVLAGLQACTVAWNAHQGYNNARGIFWEIGSLGMTMFNTIAPPNSTQYPWGDCRYTGGGYPNDATFANVNSNHPGGVNVLMADGSVRFVKSSINQYTWWALGTRANGEVDLLRLVLIGSGPARVPGAGTGGAIPTVTEGRPADGRADGRLALSSAAPS